MEQLNRVELRGTVGSIRLSSIGNVNMARLSVATNFAYKDREGCAVIETTWHSVVAFEKEGQVDIANLSKGDKVELTGRIRNQRVTGEDGTERTITEICASRLVKLPADEPMQFQN